MGKVTVIRHAEAEYPDDSISNEGIIKTTSSKERFAGFSNIVCSPKKRSQQTANFLGYSNYNIDPRLDEFEVSIVQTDTAAEYVLLVNRLFTNDLKHQGELLREAILHYGFEDTLMVSHNAVMSACYLLLTGEVTPFNNLEGFIAEIESQQIKVQRIK